MKKRIFTFLLIAAAGLSACKKDASQQNIKQYDQQQIENYISTNGLTDFKRDTSDGDSSGMYYKIINAGTGAKLEYSDRVSFVFTIKSFDSKYNSTDTLLNHYDDYLGHLTQGNLPRGLQTGIHNILKYRDASMRLLIPSNLAYGSTGYGTGSVTNVNTRIAGNQSLEYYVHVINDQQVYDDLVIRNYMQKNSLTGYTKSATGLYYKIILPGTGAIGSIDNLTTVSTTYTGALLNGTVFDAGAQTTSTSFAVNTLVTGVQEGLKMITKGGSISLLIPSRLAYGNSPPTGSIITTHTPLRFEFQVTEVTNP